MGKSLFTMIDSPPKCEIDKERIRLKEPSMDLFDSTAKQLAVDLANPEILKDRWLLREKRTIWEIKRLSNANKATQIRKFYDEVCMWEAKTKNLKIFGELLPFIKMMNAKVAYARGREHVDDKFVTFFSSCLEQITAADEEGLKVFKNFRTFFEAFVGFHKCEAKN